MKNPMRNYTTKQIKFIKELCITLLGLICIDELCASLGTVSNFTYLSIIFLFFAIRVMSLAVMFRESD